MSALQEQQKELVNVLKKQENTLRKELHETRQAVAELDVVIAKVIKEEIEKSSHELDAKDKQENKSKPKETAAFRASPEDVALSNVFAENKSRLPWPVNGFISQRFGRQPHPVLRGIMVENDGVNIQTNQDENVKAIFEGMVRAVTLNPMLGQSVLVKQGEYYVIYTCLKDVAVRQGEKISRGQLLGKVRTNSQGVAELR
ncbi:MAG: peptidase M23, partial [Candidatus Nephrothrix sp. EaCA]